MITALWSSVVVGVLSHATFVYSYAAILISSVFWSLESGRTPRDTAVSLACWHAVPLVFVGVLYLVYPLLAAAKAYLLKLIEAPYGVGEAPDKIKSAEAALQVSLAGTNHYETLNSHRAAAPSELKACYKRMALFLHPDKNPSEQATVGFKRVQDAYDILSDCLHVFWRDKVTLSQPRVGAGA